MRDLSEFHGPVTDVFASSSGRERLSQEQIEFFRENGYLGGFKILCEEQINALREALDDLMEPEQAKNPLFYEYHHNESRDASRVLFHALGAWRVSPLFHDLIFDRTLVESAELLLSGPVRFWHDQLFVKPARGGAAVAWHQDYSYWTRTKPVAHLTCWIGLDDSTVENGCVHYVPASHRWDLLPRGVLADNMEEIFAHLTDEQRGGFKPVACEMKAGEASFHHPLMIHGSHENSSERPRRAAVINFFRDGVRSDSNEPLLAGVPVIGKGEKLRGRYFPLLTRKRRQL
jgi:ectoine hydroxylase-related dioxygenase (phytanoyl-CoA dioxygenase family)